MNDPIKAKIIEAIPELWEWNDSLYRKIEKHGASVAADITLADVLRAIVSSEEYENFGVEMLSGTLSMHHARFGYRKWNLAVNWDDQTQEVKEFIGKLLGVWSGT